VSIEVSILLLWGALWCPSMYHTEASYFQASLGEAASGAGLPLPTETPCQGEGRGFETRVPLQMSILSSSFLLARLPEVFLRDVSSGCL